MECIYSVAYRYSFLINCKETTFYIINKIQSVMFKKNKSGFTFINSALYFALKVQIYLLLVFHMLWGVGIQYVAGRQE